MKWIIEFESETLLDLEAGMESGYIIELAEESEDGKTETVNLKEARVGTLGGLKMYIYANEHPPPHFHVKFNDEGNSFNIHDASPLHPNGDLRRWFKNIKKWHNDNKFKLIKDWNYNRPTDCPVGPINY